MSGTNAADRAGWCTFASLLVLTAVVAPTAGAHSQQAGNASIGSRRCTAAATEALVRSFVHRYDAGDAAAAVRLWAREPYFQWFSAGPPGARLGADAYNRATLSRYFRRRVRAHERLRLTELHAGFDPQRNIENFAGKLDRSAADLPAGRPRDFKGAADCLAGAPILIVWSM